MEPTYSMKTANSDSSFHEYSTFTTHAMILLKKKKLYLSSWADIISNLDRT
jgi:hypothetical protein